MMCKNKFTTLIMYFIFINAFTQCFTIIDTDFEGCDISTKSCGNWTLIDTKNEGFYFYDVRIVNDKLSNNILPDNFINSPDQDNAIAAKVNKIDIRTNYRNLGTPSEELYTTINSPSNSLVVTMNNLEAGADYTITFYQSLVENTISSIHETVQVPVKWHVSTSNYSVASSNTYLTNSNIWQKQRMDFTATGTAQHLGFAAVIDEIPYSNAPSRTGYLEDLNLYLLIDKILVYRSDLPCEPIDCDSYSSFNPSPGKYVLSGWVKEDISNNVISYANSSIEVSVNGVSLEEFPPVGSIIDGWQKIEGVFDIPANGTSLDINLKNNYTDGSTDVYFDDIRVHPFDGNMKSFVYDAETQRLMAELDENNYATFYEYDQEGGLVRVKKETERGVKTIQETRSSSYKR